MKIKNVLIIAGTRPEIIKLAPVIKELRSRKKHLKVTVLDSGQHGGISKVFWKIFNIKPDIEYFPEFCDINYYISGILGFFHKVIREQSIDTVIVQGDTSTAFAGALAAYNCKVPVCHVEAGLRTNNISSPWPEEGNRVMIDGISTLLFCPTQNDVENAFVGKNENSRIYLTGNTVVDAVKFIIQKNKKNHSFPHINKAQVLVTLHRRETQGKEMDQIFFELNKLIGEFPNVTWNIIKHHNPKVKESFEKNIKPQFNLKVFGSLPYDEFIDLMSRSKIIISDSGGIQEEATVLEKTVLLLRDCTERMDAVNAGWVKMIKEKDIKQTFRRIKAEIINSFDLDRFFTMGCKKNVYGKGNASKLIANAMIEHFCE